MSVDENGIPDTEVTLFGRSSAKGAIAEESEYTFRQFGLAKPRTMENGHVMLAGAPEGFPRWSEGESVVAFLYKPASATGLQTTAGLAQGKGRRGFIWWLLSIFLGPIATFLIVVLGRGDK